jgi:hypothetical protein
MPLPFAAQLLVSRLVGGLPKREAGLQVQIHSGRLLDW